MQAFPTRLRRDIHVRAAKVGEAHDIPPEARPRLAAAYILVDADALSPYEAGVAAGASRMVTRSDQLEHSVWPKAHPAISRGVCTAQCGFFIYIDVGHEAPPCRALRAPAGRYSCASFDFNVGG